MKFVDSDFLISVLRGFPQVRRKFDELLDEDVSTTSINEFEVLYGEYYRGDYEAIRVAEQLLADLRVESFDSNAAKTAAEIHTELTKNGRQIDSKDLFIASVVLTKNGTLVTGNKKHFERIPGLEIEEW